LAKFYGSVISPAFSLQFPNFKMKVRNFIGASSAILLTWLGATYFHKVPSERYPKQNRPSSVETVSAESEPDEMIATSESGVSGSP
jgi:hypothetical protein